MVGKGETKSIVHRAACAVNATSDLPSPDHHDLVILIETVTASFTQLLPAVAKQANIQSPLPA